MKLKEFARIFFTDLDIVVRDRDVIAYTTADNLALNPYFKGVREKEVSAVSVEKDRTIITLK